MKVVSSVVLVCIFFFNYASLVLIYKLRPVKLIETDLYILI